MSVIWQKVRELTCAACPAVGCEARASVDASARCPAGKWRPWRAAMSPDAKAVTSDAARVVSSAVYRQLWAELHRAPWDVPEADWAEWLAAFALRIPCGECRSHWKEVVASLKSPFCGQLGFFKWTVSAHNLVNERLNKPSMTFETAWQMWCVNYRPNR